MVISASFTLDPVGVNALSGLPFKMGLYKTVPLVLKGKDTITFRELPPEIVFRGFLGSSGNFIYRGTRQELVLSGATDIVVASI